MYFWSKSPRATLLSLQFLFVVLLFIFLSPRIHNCSMGKKDLSLLSLLFWSLCLIERRWECNWCADGKNTGEQRTMNHLLPELVVNLQWCTQQQEQQKSMLQKFFTTISASDRKYRFCTDLLISLSNTLRSSNGNSYSLRMARTIVCQTQLKITVNNFGPFDK